MCANSKHMRRSSRLARVRVAALLVGVVSPLVLTASACGPNKGTADGGTEDGGTEVLVEAGVADGSTPIEEVDGGLEEGGLVLEEMADAAPPGVKIQEVKYKGTGCPEGTVAASLASDGKSIVFAFQSLVASIGPDIPTAEACRSCQLDLAVDVPHGYSYTVFGVDVRGFVSLDEGVTAVQSAAYARSHGGKVAAAASKFQGPLSEDYVRLDEVPLEYAVWSPCGGHDNVRIDTSILLENKSNPQGVGSMTVDTLGGELKQTYYVGWRKCRER